MVIHVTAVHVSELTAVEGVFRLFLRGLLDDEVDRIVRLMIENLLNWNLLLHFEGATVILGEWLLLYNDPVIVGRHTLDITQVYLAAIINCGVSRDVLLVRGKFRTAYCRKICMFMVGD